jgi:hypothetical protein
MVLVTSSVLVLAAALWGAGLWLFVRADMTRRWKIVWTCSLLCIGVGVGLLLPARDVWSKFLWVMALLPAIAAADVLLFRSRRGMTYWIRACGFEVVTVFAAAAIARYALDLLRIDPLAGRVIR